MKGSPYPHLHLFIILIKLTKDRKLNCRDVPPPPFDIG